MATDRDVVAPEEREEFLLQERGKRASPEDEASKSSQIKMKKSLGLHDGIGIIVGVIIGSGIFISPSGVIRYSGSIAMSLFIWLFAGVFAFIGAMCYAELGTMIPKSGGEYAYIFEVFGSLPAFLFLWGIITILIPTRNTIVALTFANYILLPFFPNCNAVPVAAVKLTAASVIAFLAYLNCTNVKAAAKVQDLFTVTKLFALVIIICTGIYHLGIGTTKNFEQPFTGSNLDASSLATAFYQGLFSYSGWNYLNFVVEELREPSKNLPRAIWISVPLVTLVYLLANVAYFAVLTPDEVLSSKAVAVTFGDQTLGVMAWIIPFFVACSTFGGLNGSLFASSRLLFVGARQGHLPKMLSLINQEALSPKPSILVLASLSLIMLTFSDIQVLINYISFTESIFICISTCALLCLRYKKPNASRPIKVFIGLPILFFIICLLVVVLPIIERPVELSLAILILLVGIPVYYICVAWKNKPKWFNSTIDSLTRFVQITTNSLPEKKVE